jgi:hypothetical protein
VREDEKVTSIFYKLLEVFNFSGREGVLRSCDDEELSFLYFLEVDGLFIQSYLDVTLSYLVVIFVFLQEFLQVRSRISYFLLARVEDYLRLASQIPLSDYSLNDFSNLLFKIDL